MEKVLFRVGSSVAGEKVFCSVRVGSSSVWCGWCYSGWVALLYGKGVIQSG